MAISAAAPLDYGPRGPFANRTGSPLANVAFDHVLSFLGPKNLARIESVCRSWKQFIIIDKAERWKRQCTIELNSEVFDPGTYRPACRSYKEVLRLIFSRVLDKDTYRSILGAEIEPVPRVPEALSLKRFHEPDPCDGTKTIGEKYFWVDSPSYFKITVEGDFPFELDKADDPNDVEAPRLIPKKEVVPTERFKRKIGLGSGPKKEVLKVPNTINNLEALFKHPKNGYPSVCGIWLNISGQQGNKRIPPGRICMREDVIGSGEIFAEQQRAAAEAGVVILQLGHRILFNLLRHAKTNAYPDGPNSKVCFARTSTVTLQQGTNQLSVCGATSRNPSFLHVGSDDTLSLGTRLAAGVAVALSADGSGF